MTENLSESPYRNRRARRTEGDAAGRHAFRAPYHAPGLARNNQPVGPLGGRRSTTVVSDAPVPAAGSRIFVRLVALSTPIPNSTMTPTPIHVLGMLSK